METSLGLGIYDFLLASFFFAKSGLRSEKKAEPNKELSKIMVEVV